MKFPVRAVSVLLVAFSAWPVRADEAAPEQKLSAIEQAYVSGNKREAEKDAHMWAKAEPKAPWPKLAFASIAFHDKKYNRCLSLAKDALELAPLNADGYYWRGRCFEAKGSMLDAANEYRAALKAEAAHPAAHEGLARIQASLGDTDALPRAN